ncbi:MAG: cell division protein FtsL [Vicinamibacterales bacterium]|nr:hypothetical protein [Acidobacteriota bacterium]
MTDPTLEYALKKDVRNNPVVKDFDRERHREMWKLVGVGLLVVLVLLFAAWPHFQLLRSGYEIGRAQQTLAEQESMNRHLRLEVEALRSPARIEAYALGRLKMRAPGPSETAVVERVLPTPAPPGSVVAQR